MKPARFPDLIVLVGLPGSGKSVVGAALARQLGWGFLDLDSAIEELAGQRVAGIFADRGESAFRAMERDLTAALAQRTELVVAAGGGWMANQAAVALLRDRACFIYLRVTPATALARMGSAVSYRPLLAGSDPLGSLTRLLEERSAAYRSADIEVDGENVEVEELSRGLAGLLTTTFGNGSD
jgi:shikimate kinase